MTDVKVGAEVVAQANDKSFWNTNPLVAKAAVVGVATSVLVALGAFGIVTEEQRTLLIEAIGELTVAVFVILPLVVSIVTALWARISVYAPRTAALIAVRNAAAPSGAPPTLAPPP